MGAIAVGMCFGLLAHAQPCFTLHRNGKFLGFYSCSLMRYIITKRLCAGLAALAPRIYFSRLKLKFYGFFGGYRCAVFHF